MRWVAKEIAEQVAAVRSALGSAARSRGYRTDLCTTLQRLSCGLVKGIRTVRRD